MAQSSGGHGQNFNPNLPSSAETQRQPVAMFTEPKGIDRYHLSSRVTEQLSPKIRNFMFDDGILVSRLGTDLLGGNAASPVMQVVDLVRKGQTKVTIRFCTRHIEVYEFGLGAWNSVAIPLTGSERDFFAYTGWADKILFSNGIDGIWEFDLKTYEAKLIPGSPSAKHLTTFGGRVVASSVSYRGEDYPLRVWWTAKNLYKNWTTSQQNPTLTPDLAGGYEDLYGSPGGITDEAMGVFPFSDSQAWLVRSRSVWQMAVSGNALAPFRFDMMLPSVGTPYRNSIISLGHAVVFASREDIHEVSLSGDKLIGTAVVDDILDEVESFKGCFGTYDVGRQEYRIAIGTLVWRYRWQEEGWTADQYPFTIRALSRQIQGIADIPIDNLPATIDELSGLFPPGAINDLVYDRGFDNAMMFVPESTELTVVETDDSRDTLLTGEKTDSEIILETGVINKDQLKAIEFHQMDVEYESQMDQQLLFEFTQVDGDAWLPLSVKDIEATEGSEILFVKQERLSRKFRVRLRSLTLGKLRLLGIAPYLVVVERPMPSRKPKPASIQVLPGVLNLTVGGTQQLSVTVRDSNGASIPNVSVTLISTNNSVATVSSSGLVRAISAGSFAIVASVRNISTSVTGTVSAMAPTPVATVTVTPSISQGAAGTQQQYSATARDANGNVLVGRPVTWASSSPGFATINSSGLATLVSPGVVAISATVGGVTGGATLTVTPAAAVVDSVEVTPGTFSGEVGQTVQLVASPKDSLGNVLSGKTITWSTNASGVAIVNALGLVTMVGVGSVTITATCETIDGTSAGTVSVAVVPVASVTVTPSSFSKAPGQTQALTVVLKDSGGNVLTGRVVTYQSSNDSIATVDGSGVVTAVAQGNATITVMSEGKVGTASATVTAVPVASVVISPSTFAVTAGTSQQLVASPKDANGNNLTGRVVVWGSSDVTKATVSSSGLVTTLAAGSVTITATCETKVGASLGTIGAGTYSALNSPSTVDYVPEPNIPGSLVTFPQAKITTDRGTPSFAFSQTINPSGNSDTDAANLQTAVNNAASRAGNTRIRLGDGFSGVYSSSLNLPERSVAGKTYIEAFNLNTYAAEGVLTSPSLMGAAPKIITKTVEPAIKSAKRAKGYRLSGIEVYPIPQSASVNYNYGLVRLGNADKSDPVGGELAITDMSDDIILDRCYVHGTAGTLVQHGIILNGRSQAVVNSWVSNIRWPGVETHAIAAWSAVGPHKIVGNYLQAASINIIYGGNDPAVAGLIPADIEIRRNYLDKDLSWRGQGLNVKNLLEFKTGTRILVEGNIAKHSWTDGQEGMAFNFQSLTGNPSDVTRPKTSHLTCRYNWTDDTNIGISCSAKGFDGSGVPMELVEIANNLFTGVGGDSTNRGFLLTGQLSHLRIIHNTLIRDTSPNGMPIIADPVDGPQAAVDVVIRDNLLGHSQPYSMLFQSGGAIGTAAMNNFASSYSFDHNVTWDDAVGAGSYPATNQFAANFNAVGFNNPAAGDYSLSGSSAYKNDASDGTDPGVNWSKLMLAISGVAVSGCGLVTHQNPVPTTPLAKPAYLTPIIEPDFGTVLTRITGDPGTAIPTAGGVWPSLAGHAYAKEPVWNADESIMVLRVMEGYGGWLFLDGNTYAPLFKRGASIPGTSDLWHPTDPAKMIYCEANGSVGSWTVVADTTALIYNSGGAYSSATFGQGEGNISNDGKYVVVQATRVSDSKKVAYVVDLVAGTKGTDLDLAAHNVIADWVSISQLGGFLVAHGTIDGVDQRVKAWDRATLAVTAYPTAHPMGHFDLGVDQLGNEVGFGGDAGVVNPTEFVLIKLSDGTVTSISPPTTWDWHASARNTLRPGWGVVVQNFITAYVLSGEIYGIKLTPAGSVERYGRHRSTINDYDSAPFACPSRDGKRIVFRSSWGASNNPARPVGTYVIDVRNICP